MTNGETELTKLPEVGESDFQQEVVNSPLPALVAFGAPWSKPCAILRNELSQVVTCCTGKVRVCWVNVDDNPDLGLWYGIDSIPLLLCFVGGKVCARIVGTVSKAAILAKLDFLDEGGASSLSPGDKSQIASEPPNTSNTMFTDSAPASALPRYSAKRNLHHANFFCIAPDAKQVALVGDFNQWNPTAAPMNRMSDGRWMASLELPHGYHQYLFLVDGKPVLDPTATGKARNARNEPVSLIALS